MNNITKPSITTTLTSTPYFSIIIPTRNRPHLLRDAIASALWQDFHDFEVVVSDNFNDERTQVVLDEFLGDPRLRVVRTERLLPMPAHWEFATNQARGQYVLILTDRAVLRQHALKTIHAAILAQEKKVELCSWRWSLFDNKIGVEFPDTKCIRGQDIVVLQSRQLAQDFAQGGRNYSCFLPRGLNSCYHRDLMERVRQKWGTPFKPISPDYTSAFMFMAESPEVLVIDQSIFLWQGLDESLGLKGSAMTGLSYLKTLGDINWYTYVPIKAPIVENLIFEDFLVVQKLAKGYLEGIEISWPVYFEKCYRELLYKRDRALLPSNEIDELFNEWNRALSQFDTATKEETKKRIKSLFWLVIKIRLKKSFAGPFLLWLKRKIEHGILYRYFYGSGRSILAVAGFEVER